MTSPDAAIGLSAWIACQLFALKAFPKVVVCLVADRTVRDSPAFSWGYAFADIHHQIAMQPDQGTTNGSVKVSGAELGRPIGAGPGRATREGRSQSDWIINHDPIRQNPATGDEVDKSAGERADGHGTVGVEACERLAIS
jgi:hypothetical protein